jgi:hypothetical protein
VKKYASNLILFKLSYSFLKKYKIFLYLAITLLVLCYVLIFSFITIIQYYFSYLNFKLDRLSFLVSFIQYLRSTIILFFSYLSNLKLYYFHHSLHQLINRMKYKHLIICFFSMGFVNLF